MRRSLVSLVTTAIFCMVMAKSLGIDPVSLCDTFASKSHNLPVKTEFLTSSLKLSEVSATKVTAASSINNPSFATYTKDILVLAALSDKSGGAGVRCKTEHICRTEFHFLSKPGCLL